MHVCIYFLQRWDFSVNNSLRSSTLRIGDATWGLYLQVWFLWLCSMCGNVDCTRDRALWRQESRQHTTAQQGDDAVVSRAEHESAPSTSGVLPASSRCEKHTGWNTCLLTCGKVTAASTSGPLAARYTGRPGSWRPVSPARCGGLLWG